MPQYPVFTPPNATYLGPRVLPNGTIAVNAGPTDFSQMMMGWIPYALPPLQQIWGAGAPVTVSAASAAPAAPAAPVAPVASTPRTTSAPRASTPRTTQAAPKAAATQPGRSSYEQMLIEPENPALYVKPSVPASASATPDIKLENPDVELPAGLADIINWFIKPSPAPARSSYEQMLIEPEDPLAYARLSTSVAAPQPSVVPTVTITPTPVSQSNTTSTPVSTTPAIDLAAGLGLVPPSNVQTTTSQRNVASVVPDVDLAAGLGLVPPSDSDNSNESLAAALAGPAAALGLLLGGTRSVPLALPRGMLALPEAPIPMPQAPNPSLPTTNVPATGTARGSLGTDFTQRVSDMQDIAYNNHAARDIVQNADSKFPPGTRGTTVTNIAKRFPVLPTKVQNALNITKTGPIRNLANVARATAGRLGLLGMLAMLGYDLYNAANAEAGTSAPLPPPANSWEQTLREVNDPNLFYRNNIQSTNTSVPVESLIQILDNYLNSFQE